MVLQKLYKGQAIDLSDEGNVVNFTRKDLYVVDAYDINEEAGTGAVIVEALDGHQFQISYSEWVA